MKRLSIIGLILVWAGAAWGGSNPYVLGAQAGAAATYTDCSQIGTWDFVWFGDYSGDTDKACKAGPTVIDGSISGAGIVASTSDPGTASPDSAGNIIKFTANNQYIRWAITSSDIFSTAEGLVELDIYLSGTTDSNYIFNLEGNASNYIQAYVLSDNKIRFNHYGQGNSISMDTTATISDATWTKVYFRWSDSNNSIGVKIGNGSWQTASGSVTVFNTTLSYFTLCGKTVTNTFYIDNVKISKDSGL